MSCTHDFVQYIVDQSSGAGEITVRKMMGETVWMRYTFKN